MCWKARAQRVASLQQAFDAATFKELVERYQGKVFIFVFHIVGNREYADEISARVFAKCYASLKPLDSESAILQVLYRVAVRESFGDMRAARSRTSEAATPARRSSIVRMLSPLREEERMLLLLREVEGYSVTELGALLRTDETTVRDKLFRARRQLARKGQTGALANN